ncbi:DNA-3-methyladenine glycosylase 2 family protein [uncultured Brevundimonas sp.]|uniref:DNA-3-methyladenine glycosylase family protein n=1 Tax=uncultured Brevundimonas sp. TaxID=213418 RepID=UPI0030EF3CA2|tara:strand:- start:30609 stop:31262 length:654 start_codon:yes stop_codon:yes gene_type:complete
MNTCPGPSEIAAARAALAAVDPRLAQAHAQTPVFAWRARTGGFEGLLRMIVEQQVSVASAAAIWGRVRDGLGKVTAARVLALDIETLRGFGLSGQKARYGHEIARAQDEGRIDFDHMAGLDDAAAVAALTAIKGVGRWTAETWLMFCDGRTDLFPGGDVALQEAMRWVDRAEVRPNEKQAYARADIWQPHRGIAAHLLWGWYGGVRRGEIALEEPLP